MSDEYQGPRSFLAVLPEIRRGNLVQEVSEQLAELIQNVVVHQKAGELTIKLKVTPGKHAMNAVDITDAVTVKAPKATPVPTIFFSDEEGSVTRDDPNQPALDLQVRGKVTPIKQEKSNG